MKIIAASLLLASAASAQMWPQNAQWRASTATHADGSGPVTASDVTVLDAIDYFSNTQVEGVFAELYREGWRTYADTASLPEDDLSGCDGTNRIALALVSTQTGGPLLYLCPTTAGSWTPLFVPVGAVTSSQLTMATGRLLGRTTASTGAVEEITVSSPLTLAAGALGVGTVGVAGGGTGATSLTAYAPVCGGTTTTGAVQSCGTGLSTSGYVLTSNGASALPSWQAAAGVVSDPLTIGTLITTTSLEPRGQTSGGQAAAQVQIGSGASANGNSATWGSVSIGHNNIGGTASIAGATSVGPGTEVTGLFGTGLGLDVHVTGTNGVGIGTSVNVTGNGGIGILTGAAVPANGTGVGAGAEVGVNGLALAVGAKATFAQSMALGGHAETTAANQAVFGGDAENGWGIGTFYLGGGVTNAVPDATVTITTTGGLGTNVAGSSLRFAGGKGTGNAAGGAVVFSTSDAGASGSTLQTLTEKFRIPTFGGYSSTPLASPPYTCDAGHEGYEYSDTSHAKCWCDGTTWTVLAGAGTCA